MNLCINSYENTSWASNWTLNIHHCFCLYWIFRHSKVGHMFWTVDKSWLRWGVNRPRVESVGPDWICEILKTLTHVSHFTFCERFTQETSSILLTFILLLLNVFTLNWSIRSLTDTRRKSIQVCWLETGSEKSEGQTEAQIFYRDTVNFPLLDLLSVCVAIMWGPAWIYNHRIVDIF